MSTVHSQHLKSESKNLRWFRRFGIAPVCRHQAVMLVLRLKDCKSQFFVDYNEVCVHLYWVLVTPYLLTQFTTQLKTCIFLRTLQSIWQVQYVPLATEPAISLIILHRVATIRRTTDTHYRHRQSSSFLTQRTYSCSNFIKIHSLVLELLKKCLVR
jgi:hypothetical protein